MCIIDILYYLVYRKISQSISLYTIGFLPFVLYSCKIWFGFNLTCLDELEYYLYLPIQATFINLGLVPTHHTHYFILSCLSIIYSMQIKPQTIGHN